MMATSVQYAVMMATSVLVRLLEGSGRWLSLVPMCANKHQSLGRYQKPNAFHNNAHNTLRTRYSSIAWHTAAL